MRLDFSSIGFRPTSQEEWISKCRAMAEEAVMLAYGGDCETQAGYLLLATHWTEFADEIVRAR